MPSNNQHSPITNNFSRLLKHLALLFRLRRTSSPPGGVQREQGNLPYPYVLPLNQPQQSLVQELDLSFIKSLGTPPKCLTDVVWNLEPFLPDGCELLGRRDLTITGPHPISAGGAANVWMGEKNGAVVAVKSLRYYASSNGLDAHLKRLYREAVTCSYLNGDDSFVSFFGVYSAPDHPFALVFEYMSCLSLREHMKNNVEINRLQLLLQIARGLRHIHNLDMVHGNLRITNILVDGDGRARIAGFGMASFRSAAPAGGSDHCSDSHGIVAPEHINPRKWRLTSTEPTAASDVFAFAFVAWETFDGSPPFSDRSVVAGMYSLLNDIRPGRPDDPELSRRIWKMIQNAWRSNPAKRMTASEITAVLEEEGDSHQFN